MSKSPDILSEYGPESKRNSSGECCGGVEMAEVKPIPYSPPVGPTNQMRRAPGLGGTNIGKAGTQGRR